MMAGVSRDSINSSAPSNLNSIHPQNLPSSWRPTNMSEFNCWDRSPEGTHPVILLGPGLNPDLLPCPQPNHPSNTDTASANDSGKRKRGAPSGKTSSIGGFGPLPGDAEASSSSQLPPPFTSSGRRNAASDVWAFARPLISTETPPEDRWPVFSGLHNTSKPKTPWFGCTLCSEFGCLIRPSAFGHFN